MRLSAAGAAAGAMFPYRTALQPPCRIATTGGRGAACGSARSSKRWHPHRATPPNLTAYRRRHRLEESTPLPGVDQVRHPNQVCQGSGTHFPHHRTAVNLGGDLADSEVASDLLVHLPRRDQ
jgi:hypothetical protein